MHVAPGLITFPLLDPAGRRLFPAREGIIFIAWNYRRGSRRKYAHDKGRQIG